jgi:hypothetical protein
MLNQSSKQISFMGLWLGRQWLDHKQRIGNSENRRESDSESQSFARFGDNRAFPLVSDFHAIIKLWRYPWIIAYIADMDFHGRNICVE